MVVQSNCLEAYRWPKRRRRRREKKIVVITYARNLPKSQKHNNKNQLKDATEGRRKIEIRKQPNRLLILCVSAVFVQCYIRS